MQSIRELYKVGKGPSSSHTMGPYRAARIFFEEHPEADRFEVILYGSLAKTGRGHGTDRVIKEAFAPLPCTIQFDYDEALLPHPNTLDFYAHAKDRQTGYIRVISVGGGDIRILGRENTTAPDLYPLQTFGEIATLCKHRNIRLSDYVFEVEGDGFEPFLYEIWKVMQASIMDGLSKTGVLPGGLGLERKAQHLFQQRHIDESPITFESRTVCAYAYAASEQNADGGTVVTAPTCGSCAVVPAVLLHMQQKKGFSDRDVIRALAVGGLMGNLIKHNASISGAQCGCQAEIGSACSMAAAALCELFRMGIDQIEYAAEMSLEHHLGLTCDPVRGLVQIPCIERNAVAAMRAINALTLANFLSGTRKISFDLVVRTMYETGCDLSNIYRETAEGGLAKLYGSKEERIPQ